MNGVDDPVNPGITTDRLVLWVDEDDFVVFVGGVLIDPVGVEDPQVCAAAADTLFGGRSKRALVLQLVDTHVGRLACKSDTIVSIKVPQSSYPRNSLEEIIHVPNVAPLGAGLLRPPRLTRTR